MYPLFHQVNASVRLKPLLFCVACSLTSSHNSRKHNTNKLMQMLHTTNERTQYSAAVSRATKNQQILQKSISGAFKNKHTNQDF